ncbi:synaptonemal complex protein 2 isoform X2 [Chrysemys picta bellii]|uniref:synaptonemal complex protein 2 isoform X2 n=1 Tax=Chrysemys picta bellii TaxID=8478 RepID=UPI001C67ED46|nr:synaptonemal complex protein 2 isoform X2 [Chrysemys picta bellii]XP_042714339.1 synaptonemal complex protein 2 isoform X2 [Chrysemys picta bellii]
MPAKREVQELDKQEVKNVSTLLNSLQKHGKNIIIPGGDGFQAMIKYGLVEKMVSWFEKAKEILIFRRNEKNEALTSLVEDFFDVLMLVHDTNSEGKIQTLESFILRICTLVADVRINIYIQQEAVRKLNSMLDTMPREARKKIISTKEMFLVMNDMGKRILDAGDYDLQVAITEALCRMTSEKQRGELARQWFSMAFVTNAFKGIKDSEFETDCRKFLNQVNGMLGDKRRVFTYPCLSAILDKYELQIPLDENLDEFWIDFNVGSRSISFYVAADDEDHQWETVSIPEEEVEMYSLEEKESKKLLTIILKNPVTVGNQEGEQMFLYFDPVLEIMEVARKVYGANKCKGFTKKQATSVAKTSVHIIFDESGSQVLVPESQLSPCLKEKSGMEGKSSKSVKQQLPVQQRNWNIKTNQENCKNIQSKITTPTKRKVSEASVIVPGTGRLPLRSPLVFVNSSTPRKARFKLPLQMMSSSEKNNITRITESGINNLDLENTGPHISSIADSLKRRNVAAEKGRDGSVLDDVFCETQQNTSKTRIRNEAKLSEKQHMSAEKVLEMIQNEADSETSQKQTLHELLDIVPDSQPVGRNDKPLLPGLLESSADENKIWKKQACSVPEKLITKCDKQKRSTSSGHTFQQVPGLSERAAKQKAFYSIFESTSPKQQAQNRKISKKQQNETEKPEENCIRHRGQTLNSSNHLEQKILSTEAKEVPTTPKTSFNSVYPTKMTEKSLGYSTKLVLARNSKEEVDVSLRKGTTNHKKSETVIDSHLGSSDLAVKGMKAKSKEMAEPIESIISKISDRYKQKDDIEHARKARDFLANNRSCLNKSGFKVNKEKVQNRSCRNVKTRAVLNMTTGHIVDDVYNFNLSGFDEPTIKLGVQELHVTNLKASTNLTEKKNPDESKSTIQKKVDNKNRTNKNKKHLFSDTDTEYRGDDSKTDISWLRESNRKPKPQLIDYSRTKNLKKSKSIEATDTFCDPACLMDISEGKKTKNKKVPGSKKQNTKADERIKQTTRPKWPRRAALAKKSYKDYSNSESESEQESSQYLRRKEKFRVQQEHKNGQNKAVSQHKELQNNVSTEPKKGISRNQQQIFTKSKDPIKQRKLEMSPVASPESPASVETMRCAEKVPEETFTQEQVSLKRSSSSYLQDSTPEKRESLRIVKGISANKLYTTKKNKQSIHLKQSPENVKKLVFGNESLSPVLSSLSLPSLTPVTMDKAVTSGKDTEVTEPEVEICDISEAVNVTNYLSDKLSITAELKDLTKNMQNKGEESVPPSQLYTSSGSREQSWCEDPCGTIHESGPTVQVNLKRMYHSDAESDSDEVEMKKEEERKTKLLPRKLFKADDDTVYKEKSIMQCARTHSFSRNGKKWGATNEITVSESISTVSVNELSVLDGEVCDPGCSNIGIGQKLHKEFTRKIQSRSRRMDHFTKQSLKTAQQHLTTVSCQLHECRIKQLDKFHFTIVEELESFEKDSQSLKNMEKELLNFWKKHALTFSACKKNEQRRIQILKTSFEKHISHSVNYEENIFTSEMHLMKEDMKGLQEKLLKEMHEEELFNVRRGLQTLFLAEGRKF